MNDPHWFFDMQVRVSVPGEADVTRYYCSELFNDFSSCYEAYYKFNPHEYFPGLYAIVTETMTYRDDNIVTHKTELQRGGILYDHRDSDAWKKLGCSEKEIDDVLVRVRTTYKAPHQDV